MFKRLTKDQFLNYRRKDFLKQKYREKNHVFFGKKKTIIKNKTMKGYLN